MYKCTFDITAADFFSFQYPVTISKVLRNYNDTNRR